MNGTWITGEAGANKIFEVNRTFHGIRRTYWSDKVPLSALERFQPWMTKDDLGGFVIGVLSPEDFDRRELLPSSGYCKRLLDIYSTSTYTSAFKNTKARPSYDLYEKFPEAEDLHRTAYQFLCDADSWMARLAQGLILEILPIALNDGPYNGLGGMSDPCLLGTIFLGVLQAPFQRSKTIIALAHELGHQALFNLQTIDNLAAGQRDRLVYSGVRRVDRPLLYSLHAAVALVYMIESENLLLGQEDLPADERLYLESVRRMHGEALHKATEAMAKIELSKIGQRVQADLVLFSKQTGSLINNGQ